MKAITVKDLMRPLSEYRIISAETNLFEAAQALEQVQREFEQNPETHRIILIANEHGEVVGKISQLDVLRVLEPKGPTIKESRTLSRFGISKQFLKPMLNQCSFWEKPRREICKDAGRLKVEKLIHAPAIGEFVEEDASLTDAIHQLALEHHQSLLVTKGRKIVGVLRQKDVFKEVFETLASCEL